MWRSLSMLSTRLSEFRLVDRLGKKVVGAGLHGPLDVAQLVERGNH